MGTYELTEFLNDERFISEKIKVSYLKQNKFVGTQKSTILKNFLKYYESCTLLKKERNKPQLIELGSKREVIKENDKRKTRQTSFFVKAVQNTIDDFIIENNYLMYQEYTYNAKYNYIDGYHYETVWNFFFALGFSNETFKKFTYEVKYPTSEEKKSLITNKYFGIPELEDIYRTKNKDYINAIYTKWSRIFKQAIRNYDTKESYMMVIKLDKESIHRRFTAEEQAKFESFEYQLLKRNDISKVIPFKKKTEAMENYEREIKQYLIENYGAIRMYKTIGLKILKDIKHDNSLDMFFKDQFLLDFKEFLDNQRIKSLYESYQENLKFAFYENFEEEKKSRIAEFLMDINKLDSLDDEYLNTYRSAKTQKLIDKYIILLQNTISDHDLDLEYHQKMLEILYLEND